MPDFSTIPYQTAICHFFCYDERQWRRTRIRVQLAPVSFARGSSRVAFYLQIAGDKYLHVAKQTIDPSTPGDIYFRDSEMQAHCAHFARQFNSFKPPRKVQFLKTWVLELLTPQPPLGDGRMHHSRFYGVERHIRGTYRKHNNNFGFVDDDVARNTPQAFSHFTLETTAHSAIVVDIQGVNDIYTDPQMHTVAGDNFGDGNFGMRGVLRFCQTHQCNNICRYLGLPPINPKHNDSGTCIRSPLKNLSNCVTNTNLTNRSKGVTNPNLKLMCQPSRDLGPRGVTNPQNIIQKRGKTHTKNAQSGVEGVQKQNRLRPVQFQEKHCFEQDLDLRKHLARHSMVGRRRRSASRAANITRRDAPTCTFCAIM